MIAAANLGNSRWQASSLVGGLKWVKFPARRLTASRLGSRMNFDFAWRRASRSWPYEDDIATGTPPANGSGAR